MPTAQTIAKDLRALADALLEDIETVITSLSNETLNTTPKGLQNNPFTIIYHLLGSARYWIGEVVGGLDTGRIRADEFNRTGTKMELIERLEDTRQRIRHALEHLTDKDLQDQPIDLSKGVLSWGELPPKGRTSIWVIAHDLSHVAYHLGQLKLIEKMVKNIPVDFTSEEVLTIYNYWDGPKHGIANYKGKLHIYEAIFDEEKDDFSNTFWLMPTTKETLQLALDSDKLWRDWLAGEGKGKTTYEASQSFYMVEKHKAMKVLLEEQMKIKPEESFKVKASFYRPQPRFNHFQVKWERVR